MNLDPELLDAIAEALGEAPQEITPLSGATSSRLYRIRLLRRDAVVRCFLPERWDEPVSELSVREHSILETLASSGLPVPEPIGLLRGDGVAMSFVPGRVWLPQLPTPAWFDEVAHVLSRIHECTVTVPFRYRSWNTARGEPAPGWWQSPALWSAAQHLLNTPPEAPGVFIHRDYHPVNLLWEEQHVSGVVDWINACMGPPGVDVAHCRINLALMYGMEAADAFLDAYQRYAPGYEHHPYWDVDDALSAPRDVLPYAPWAEFGLTGLTPEIVRRRLEAFVQAAVS